MTSRIRSDSVDASSTSPATKKLRTKGNHGEEPRHQATAVQRACAKWCSIEQDGTALIDETRMKCWLPQTQREDSDFMRDVVHGRVLNARVYPLIFEAAQPDAPDVIKFRTLPNFIHLLSDGGSHYQSLTRVQKKIIAVSLRDLYIADATGLLSEQEKHILESMVQLVDEDLETRHVGGMAISFYPSKNFSIIKFIESLDDKVGHQESDVYAQLLDTPKLFAVFVSPADLSYHNFENIVPLDSWIEANLPKQDVQGLDISLIDPSQIRMDREIFTCKLQGTVAVLKDLSLLDLYVAPPNKGTRGGQRFIFHSALLSKVLSGALKSSGVLDMLAGGRLKSSFEFVNSVFRCNRFHPEDAHFSSHSDTPYYDGARSHVSKYTLLIYLTAGHNDEVLRIEDVSLAEFQEMTCVVFDQRYQHEGWPFLDGKKTFIRTELVFKHDQLRHDHKASALFSEACYMTGQSLFHKTLDSYAHECFERANSLRWAIEKSAPRPPTYLHKTFQGIDFLTNGHNYWFLRGSGIDPKDCALVALFDYFNCKVGSQPFQSLVSLTKIQDGLTSEHEIWSYLSTHKSQTSEGLRRLKKADIDQLFPTASDRPFKGRLEEWDGEDDELEEFDKDGDGCCPMHSFPMFNPWKSNQVMEAYQLCCDYTRKKLFGAPVLLLDQQIVINDANIEIIGDKIFILREKDGKPLPPVNFAACWGYEPLPPDFVVVGDDIATPDLLVPPLSLHESAQGYQLGLDFFRNDWMVAVDEEQSVAMPNLSECPEDETKFTDRVPEIVEDMKIMFEYWE